MQAHAPRLTYMHADTVMLVQVRTFAHAPKMMPSRTQTRKFQFAHIMIYVCMYLHIFLAIPNQNLCTDFEAKKLRIM